MSPEVTEALLERERLAKSLQDEEEQARLKASALVVPGIEKTEQSGTAGSLEETLDADAKWGKPLDDQHKEKVLREAERLRHTDLVRKLERKLAFVSFLKFGFILSMLLSEMLCKLLIAFTSSRILLLICKSNMPFSSVGESLRFVFVDHHVMLTL